MTKITISVLLVNLLFGSAEAAEIAGVKIDDNVQLEGVATPLVLNRAGVRK